MTTATGKRTDLSRIVLTGVMAAVIAAVVNVVVALVLRALLDVDAGYVPLTPGPIIASTLIACLIGTGIYALLARTTNGADRLFTIIAWGFAILSLGQLLVLFLADGDALRIPAESITTSAILATVPLHLIPPAILVPALTRRRSA